jgi:hypothetical protein
MNKKMEPLSIQEFLVNIILPEDGRTTERLCFKIDMGGKK